MIYLFVSGNPQNTGTGTLTILVKDVNDNFPIFAKDYRPQIVENTPPIANVQTIQAKDIDEPQNGPPFKFWLPCNGKCCPTYTLCNKFGMVFDNRKYLSFYILSLNMTSAFKDL